MNWAWDEGMPCCTKCTVCCTAGRGSEKGHCKETNFDSLFMPPNDVTETIVIS